MDIINFLRRFRGFVGGVLALCLTSVSDLGRFFCGAFRGLGFVAAECVGSVWGMFGKVYFSCRFGRIVVRYKKIGYNIDDLR